VLPSCCLLVSTHLATLRQSQCSHDEAPNVGASRAFLSTTTDRHPWIVNRLSAAFVMGAVLSVPAVLASVLRGEFTLTTEEKMPIGRR